MKNWPPTVWQNNLAETHLCTRIFARAYRCCHRRFPVGGRVKKRNKEQRRIPDVSFQKVEGHQHNFVSLKIPDVN
jgi:hypothetical protein